MRLRRQGPAQSGQGISDAAPLRRARAHACARGAGSVSGYSEVLNRRWPTTSNPAIGPPAKTDQTLDLSALPGVPLYEPQELVLSAKAGTPLAEIEALLAANAQQLAFEPMDYAAVLGGVGGRGTIGGALAANVSGPRRIKVGAAR